LKLQIETRCRSKKWRAIFSYDAIATPILATYAV
jgi:hypothetical protein